jgi:hypothetical protein
MSTNQELIVEGDLLPDVIDNNPPAPLTLFGTSDPKLAAARMQEVADVLLDVVRSQKLVLRIQGRDYLTVEGWTTLGGLLGVVPIVEWTRPLEDGSGWEARVEARTVDGRLVGAGESMCSRSESTWSRRDEFALRSMAQTRAIGRALQGPLRHVVKMAGYEPAGAEEIPAVEPEVLARRPTREQLDEIAALLRSLEQIDPGVDWKARCREIIGVPREQMTPTVADHLIRQLQAQLAELVK